LDFDSYLIISRPPERAPPSKGHLPNRAKPIVRSPELGRNSRFKDPTQPNPTPSLWCRFLYARLYPEFLSALPHLILSCLGEIDSRFAICVPLCCDSGSTVFGRQEISSVSGRRIFVSSSIVRIGADIELSIWSILLELLYHELRTWRPSTTARVLQGIPVASPKSDSVNHLMCVSRRVALTMDDPTRYSPLLFYSRFGSVMEADIICNCR
jgi:hypothetical protein